jgi:hypothetical protein
MPERRGSLAIAATGVLALCLGASAGCSQDRREEDAAAEADLLSDQLPAPDVLGTGFDVASTGSSRVALREDCFETGDLQLLQTGQVYERSSGSVTVGVELLVASDAAAGREAFSAMGAALRSRDCAVPSLYAELPWTGPPSPPRGDEQMILLFAGSGPDTFDVVVLDLQRFGPVLVVTEVAGVEREVLGVFVAATVAAIEAGRSAEEGTSGSRTSDPALAASAAEHSVQSAHLGDAPNRPRTGTADRR